MQEILWWWPNLIYFHDVFMNIFRKKWPVVGAFLHLVILPVPSLTKSCDLSTSGGCKDKMNKMRAYDPNKVVGPTIFLWCFPKFWGEDEANFGRRFFNWVARQFLLCRGRSIVSLPHKSRGKGP